MENSVFRTYRWPVSVNELLVAAHLPEAEDHQPQGADDHQNCLHKVGPDHRRQAAAWTQGKLGSICKLQIELNPRFSNEGGMELRKFPLLL